MEKIEKLFKEAIKRAELECKTDCRSCAVVFLSFFLPGMIGGLREPAFVVKKQTILFASLSDNYFTGALKPPQ